MNRSDLIVSAPIKLPKMLKIKWLQLKSTVLNRDLHALKVMFLDNKVRRIIICTFFKDI